MANEQDTLRTTLKFAGEAVIPGGANLVKGDWKQAGVHAVLGIVAKSIFGLPGLIAVSANSFTKATTGRGILDHLGMTEEESPRPARKG